MEGEAVEARNLDSISCYAKAAAYKTGGGMSSPSTTMTPASSSHSMPSRDHACLFPYTARDDLDNSLALETMFGLDPAPREPSFEATCTSSPEGCMSEFSRCRHPQAKRQSRPSSSRTDPDSGSASRRLAVRDAGGSSSGSEDQASSTIRFPRPSRHQKIPETFTSTFEPLHEDDEFAFVQVAADDVTICYPMQEHDQQPQTSPPSSLSTLLLGARPCSWPVCQPSQNVDRQPRTAADDTAELSIGLLLMGTGTRPSTWSTPQPEQPQERVQFAPPIRNTFIHYDTLSEYSEGTSSELPAGQDATQRWSSAPGAVLPTPFTTKYPKMEENHNAGNCRPCAYFFHKEDGCRNGGDCKFCHLCPEGAQKIKKKAKIRYLKDCDAAEKASSSPSLTVS